MRRYKVLTVILAMLISAARVVAYDIVVTVTPTQKVLPPQLALYITDPSQFFTVTLNNTGGEDQDVYLGLQLEHVMPNDGLSIATPPQYQPDKAFTIPAGGSYSLTTADMKNLFNHIPSSAMKIPEALMEGYMNGSFGLLPEGNYEVHFQAYKWHNPKYAEPVPCSNPIGGRNDFIVCYKASAPTFLTPVIGVGDGDFTVAEMKTGFPQLSWTQPVVTCNPGAATYTYTVRIVELLTATGQQPDAAMDKNPVIYQSGDLTSPMLTLDKVTLQTKFEVGKTYVAQVTAKQSGATAMNYVSITNEGKSPLRIFKLVDGTEDDKNRLFSITEGDIEEEGGADTLYRFRNPTITSPNFPDEKVRRLYQEADVMLSWDPAWYLGGVGKNPYDLEMEYVVEMFNGHDEADMEKALASEPIYTTTTKEVKYDIPWEEIKGKVNLKDYVVLRVRPNCTNLAEGDSINFENDTINVMDFTMAEHISPNHFACTPTVILENFELTTKEGKDFEGKEVALGEYQLTIDKVEGGNREKGFNGRGRVKWELPVGTAMVHVKFDTLRINTDDVAIGGLASTYAGPTMSNYEAVENIFSDLGLEDMLVEAGVPYAEKLEGAAKKTISDKIDGLANYYSLVKSSQGIYDLLTGGTTDIYMPICLPKEKVSQLNSSPVDIQITTMKFAPTWATMDLLGEFTMPKSECLASDLLIFGAPRLCISPNHVIPEAGTLALLDKFTVKEPSTEFMCTFNAPSDLLEPTDGCFIAWKNYKFEVMGVDIDMKIPGLKKYDVSGDKVTEELPNLKMKGVIASWDDFKIDEITMDPFEADDLPGFTFTCQKMAYDHSVYSNCSGMSSFKFPEEYDKREGVGEDVYMEHGLDGWQGLYVGELSVAMPKGITGTDGRLKIAGKNMLFDRSGVTLDADLEELIGASIGDFSFEINRVGLTFIQNNFDNCHIDGKLGLPILKGEKGEPAEIGLNCQIRKQIDDKGKKGDEFVYVFNTKSLNGDYTLDLFLAKLELDDKLTYFLVEAEPQKKQGSEESELKTKCELLLGGKIEIGGKETIEKWAQDKVGYKLSLPDIHFVGMRMANCKPWKSKYVDIQADIEKERAQQKKDALGGFFKEGKEFHNGKKDDGSDATFFFHTGSWSLASYKKQLGPFEFSIEDYEITKNFSGTEASLGLQVTGKVALVKGIDISGEVTLSIGGKLTGIGTDLSKISGEFDGVHLQAIGVHTSFCGMSIDGAVEFYEKGQDPAIGKGFYAKLDIQLPGDLFGVHGDGGYFEYEGQSEGEESYSWGWVHLSVNGKIELGPCAITKLGGGFYMNCSRNPEGDDKKPKNVAGLVGIFMELGMASPDGETLKGELTLNVVYNRKRKCLSTFNMTGNVKGVGGIINAKMTLVYENSPSDRYLQLNITMDASLSAESVAGAMDSFGANLGTIKDQMQMLAGDKFQEIITDCKQGLSSKIGANAKDPTGDPDKEEPTPPGAEEDPGTVANASKTKKQGGLPKMGATISLDMKITWRAGGEEYKKPKWHLYLGEPDEKKRCTLTLIDFDSGIVDCHVGANAYICLGNELPNNGELPPLPDKIAKFLDGSKHGDYQSDNASQAQQARQLALQGFNGDISGGVMMGAMAYGDLTIDLGLIKGTIDAILGFDVSVVHYKNGYCVNLGKVPGYRGWYGRGQLYAYLYLALSLHFNLGFVDYDFDIASAEIGGVLKMGGPKPNYFQGKARAKISLLGGLFKFDKSFEFECGQYCQLFKGNPLDDFILFDDCTLGDTIRGKGWTKVDKNKVAVTADMQPKVKVNVSTPQYANTKAPLTEHFRLLDENELERIAAQFGEGSEKWEQSKMQAKRTFVFRDFGEVWLYEYDDPSSYTSHTPVAENASFNLKKMLAQEWCGAKKMYTIPLQKGGGKSRHYIDLGELRKNLKAGKFYRLVAAGYAKEIQKGVEEDPFTYYDGGKKKGNIPWVKSTEYYFQTEDESIVNDKAPLQDYVAIAYPSHYNQLRSPEADISKTTGAVNHIKCYLNDVKAPTIALTEDLSTKAFKNGKLYWRLLNPMGKQLDIVENAWVKGTATNSTKLNTINMEPARRLNAKAGEKYILQLDYYTREYVSDDEFNPDDKKWMTMDTTLVKLYVETLPEKYTWRTGTPYSNIRSCEYDQPFIAQKITSATINPPYSSPKTDTQIHNGNYFTQCPITFISYMSNFAFPAGWEITERNFFNIEVTTSESVFYQDANGGGKYEGAYNQNNTYNVHNAWNQIKNTFIYTIPENRTTYPLQYPLAGTWHKGNYGSWDYVHDVDERITAYYPTSTSDWSWSLTEILSHLQQVYSRTEKASKAINKIATEVEKKQREYGKTEAGQDMLKSCFSCYALKEYNKKEQKYDTIITANNYYQQRDTKAIQKKKTLLKEWYDNHRGTYVNEDGQYVHSVDDTHSFFVPAYQFPVIWSIGTLEGIDGAYKGMKKDNSRAKVQGPVWGKMTGMKWLERYQAEYRYRMNKKWHTDHYWSYRESESVESQKVFSPSTAKNLFKELRVSVYRVNAYDTESGHYEVIVNLLNGSSQFNLLGTDPLTSSAKFIVASENFGNTSNSSLGTKTGSSNYVPVDTKTFTSTLTSSEMDYYLRQVKEMHDSCQQLFDYCDVYWPRYKSRAEKLVKAAAKAEKSAINAVKYYADSNGNESQFGQMYDRNKTLVQNDVKDARKWRDSVNVAVSYLSPNQPLYLVSPITFKYGRFRTLKTIATHLAYYMDTYITPQSDPNDAQYKRYRSMQDEASSWLTKLQEWYNEAHASRYDEGGYCKEAIKLTDWAEKELNKLTPENAAKVRSAAFSAYDCRNQVVNVLLKKVKEAGAAADKALADAKKKTGYVDYTVVEKATGVINRYDTNVRLDDLDLIDIKGIKEKGAASKVIIPEVSNPKVSTPVSNPKVSTPVNTPKVSTPVNTPKVNTPLNKVTTPAVRNVKRPDASLNDQPGDVYLTIPVPAVIPAGDDDEVVVGRIARAGAEKKNKKLSQAEKDRGKLISKLINEKVNVIEDLKTLISDLQAVLDDYDIINQSLETMEEQTKLAPPYDDKIVGEGGYAQVIRETMNDQCAYYKNSMKYHDEISQEYESMTAYSSNIRKTLDKLPKAEEIRRNLEAAKRKLDQAEGRDTLQADRLMGRVDSLLAVVQKRMSKFDIESLRRKGYDNLWNIYHVVLQYRRDYMDGDLRRIPDCIAECEKYPEALAQYEAYYQELAQVPPFIQTAADDVWEDFHAAGYDDSHEVVQKARKLWADENRYDDATTVLAEVAKWLSQVQSLANDGDDSIESILAQAKKDLENPSPELLEKLGDFVVSKMDEIERHTHVYSGHAKWCNDETERSLSEFDRLYSEAKNYWSKYESLLPVFETPERAYLDELSSCRDNCNHLARLAGDLKTEYDTQFSVIEEQAQKDTAKANRYMEMIPADFASNPNLQASVKRAQETQKKVMDNCARYMDAASAMKVAYEETLPKRYAEEVRSFRAKVEQAYNYLRTYHKPQLVPEIVVPGYVSDIKKRSADAGINSTAVNRYDRVSQTDYEAFMTARNKMHKYWLTYQDQKARKLTSSTLRTTLANCIAEADKMLTLSTRLLTDCDAGEKLIDGEMKSFDIVRQELNYVRQNASVSPRGYSSASSYSDGMRKTVEKMSSKRPTLESRRRSVIQYGQEANDMKSKATSENRNIGSKAFRR